jgi:hypothetical protein
MTPDLIAAAVALADTLAQENKALAALDLPRAAGLLAEKTRAADAFAAAWSGAAGGGQHITTQLAGQLRDLASENKRLLERALTVQGRVIEVVVSAIPRAVQGPPRYNAGGAVAGPRQMPPVSLSARA